MRVAGSFSDLKGMIDYRKGAIVSRELLKTNSGTVILFAFDQGQASGSHSDPHEAMVFILDGEAQIALENQPRRIAEGEMIMIPALHPHSFKAVHCFKMLLILMMP